MAGKDYPQTYREFVQMFPDDAACAGHLELVRRIHLPVMWDGNDTMAPDTGVIGMPGLSPSGVDHCGHDLRQDKDAADDLV